MTIPESQLDTWSGQGAVVSAKQTHESIRNALASEESPIKTKDFQVYLQGSYKNDTNIRGNSDVDLVVQLDRTFKYDLCSLTEQQKLEFDKAYENATYTFVDFRKDVLKALQDYYGKEAVIQGNKSLKLKGGSGRLSADIIPCLQYRKYTSFQSINSQSFVEGITFFTLHENSQIVNFPGRHYQNGVAKNSQSQTNGWYKPTVRAFKNCRTRMEDRSDIEDGIAPSYFVECLLFNVPSGKFGKNYQTTFYNILAWLADASLEGFKCQNGQLSLFGGGPEQWSKENARTFISALIDTWNTWE